MSGRISLAPLAFCLNRQKLAMQSLQPRFQRIYLVHGPTLLPLPVPHCALGYARFFGHLRQGKPCLLVEVFCRLLLLVVVCHA